MSLPDYSPRNVTVTWGGYKIIGFAEDFLVVNPSVDLTTSVVGADGKVAITISPDESGTIEVTLLQTAPSNIDLSRILEKQTASGVLFRNDLTIVDRSGSFNMEAKGAHIMQRPEVTLGIEQNNKTWTFYVEELVYKIPQGLAQDTIEGIKARVDGLAETFEKNAKDAFKKAIANNLPG